MHSYQDVHGRLPPAVVYGADEKPLLSWRVLLLPFIEQGPLYAEFKLDEPWDSANNIRLLERMPAIFRPFDGSRPPQPDSTFYQVFVGPGTAFEGREGLRFKEDFSNGLSETFLIVEASGAVPWSKPEDLSYSDDIPVPKLGGIFPRTFRVARCDGSIDTLADDTPEMELRDAIKRVRTRK